MRKLVFLFCLVPVLAGMPAHADDDRREREELTAARKRGEILPLAEILDRWESQTGGRIIEVEFEKDDGRTIYEIYYLDAGGRRREIKIDARDGSELDGGDDD
jgi:uncharacterized membrane protein YkoI